MRRSLSILFLSVLSLVPFRGANADVTFNVDAGAAWQGFMNVFETPENGGFYVFSSAWGVEGLPATFNLDETVLTLAPNSVNDPNPFWYTPAGGPGSVGNKVTDANFYVETPAGSLAGQSVTFQGEILAQSLTFEHTAKAFIRDFAPDYSSFTEATFDLVAPGPFSVNLVAIDAPDRHVQYGFNFNGRVVWITDVAPYGNVQIAAIPSSPTLPGDFDEDGDVDGRDFLIWQRGETTPSLDPGLLAEWQEGYVTGGLSAFNAVPEPTSIALVALMSGVLTLGRVRRSA